MKEQQQKEAGDPGKFTIPCSIGKAPITKALCDLGASVSLMPYTIFQKIGVGDLKPTRMTIQLADTTTRLPLGVVEDVPIQVGKFFVPGDFVVMDMAEDKDVPIILGRPFLRTARTIIDTHEGTLTMNVGGEKVKFKIEESMKYPDMSEDCNRVDITDQEEQGKLVETHQDLLKKDELGPVGTVDTAANRAQTGVTCGPHNGPTKKETDRSPPRIAWCHPSEQ